MSLSLILVCLWVLSATGAAMMPSRRSHWPAAYVLIATGIPLLGFVTYENGPVVGLICLAAGASILRWPLLYLARWITGAPRSVRSAPTPQPRMAQRTIPPQG
ncbi:hypothetical protein CBW24_12030 [Pacificitalea manganoxidans]|uniref:DUF2484 family protein n=1 Tax=Pacificitalea manganoxidans TaxID=1411902 RepID=A0A291M129_9RHOB|nr:DUF2484 family protein [Pacificitalea manganoxidans]ATI42659.1 hypothetical protein CBW24_12030 [Pacificitalea manganoxidans]MBF52506.1 hypothetical protein [Actibacterium sp.]MDR6307458.1 hypothetical protein [Pacificitalea manganoxidans]